MRASEWVSARVSDWCTNSLVWGVIKLELPITALASPFLFRSRTVNKYLYWRGKQIECRIYELIKSLSRLIVWGWGGGSSSALSLKFYFDRQACWVERVACMKVAAKKQLLGTADSICRKPSISMNTGSRLLDPKLLPLLGIRNDEWNTHWRTNYSAAPRLCYLPSTEVLRAIDVLFEEPRSRWYFLWPKLI